MSVRGRKLTGQGLIVLAQGEALKQVRGVGWQLRDASKDETIAFSLRPGLLLILVASLCCVSLCTGRRLKRGAV